MSRRGERRFDKAAIAKFNRGDFVGYYLPTRVAAVEQYRERRLSDADAVESLRRAEAAGCILIEDRSFVRLIAARAVQGVGAAILVPNSLAILNHAYPDDK